MNRSEDLDDWNQLGSVDGNGTTNEISNYEFIDDQPIVGVNYYRLKQVDYDGQFEYSEIRSVSLFKDNSIVVYPIPTSKHIHVEFKERGVRNAEVVLIDALGKEMQKQTWNSANSSVLILDVKEYLPGVYYLQTTVDGTVITQKVAIE